MGERILSYLSAQTEDPLDIMGDNYDSFTNEGIGYGGGNYKPYKLNMDIPPFNGTLYIEEFINWRTEVDRLFNYMNISTR